MLGVEPSHGGEYPVQPVSQLNLVLLGPPGSGKGTQGERLQEDLELPYYATGDILRQAVREETEIGKEAKAYMDKGDLVPDEVIIGVIAERIDSHEAEDGFILDGFPRTVAQAEAFDAMLAEKGLKLDAVIEFKVNEGELVDRIVKRAKETEARGEPVRKDDNPEVFKTRLDAYKNQTAPLSAYYERTGMLKTVDGMKPIDDVTVAIKEILRR